MDSPWTSVSLSSLVSLINGTAFNADDWRDSGIPIIRIQNLNDREAPFNYFQGDLDTKVVIEDGDLLFSWSGSRGTSFGPHVWRGSTGVLNQHIFKVANLRNNAVDRDYLFYALKHLTRSIESKAHGLAALVHVRKGDLLSTQVPLPPLPEQRAIAHVLRTVQRAKEATEGVLRALEHLKRSLSSHLFSNGAVPMQRHVEFAETRLGPLPAHWTVQALGNLGRIGNGSTPKRDKGEYWHDGNIPWLTSAKVHESLIEMADEFVTECARTECHLPVVKANSVLVAITGQGKTLGNAAMVTFDTCISQHLAYIQLFASEVEPEFLLYYLQSRYGELHRAGQAGGSTKGALTCGFLKSYIVPVPPVAEQRGIVTTLRALSAKQRAEGLRLESLREVQDRLLADLMTGKLRAHDMQYADAIGSA